MSNLPPCRTQKDRCSLGSTGKGCQGLFSLKPKPKANSQQQCVLRSPESSFATYTGGVTSFSGGKYTYIQQAEKTIPTIGCQNAALINAKSICLQQQGVLRSPQQFGKTARFATYTSPLTAVLWWLRHLLTASREGHHNKGTPNVALIKA